MEISYTGAFGRPSLNGFHVLPPSVLLYRLLLPGELSRPTKRAPVLASTLIVLAGTPFGRPVSEGLHLAPPFTVMNTFGPATNPETVTHAISHRFGSTANRVIGPSGKPSLAAIQQPAVAHGAGLDRNTWPP